MNTFETFTIELAGRPGTTGRLYAAGRPPMPASLVLAHGAGVGQHSPWMVSFAGALAARGIDVVTFDFPYMAERRHVPDRADVLVECYRAAVAAAQSRVSREQRLVLGGKSLGGRMASMLAAEEGPDFPAAGLVFLGYPLHPPGRPDQLRVDHWPRVRIPALFVQGTRDAFGTPEELERHVGTLGAPATVYRVDGGDHSLAVRSSGSRAQVLGAVQDEIARWIRALTRSHRP